MTGSAPLNSSPFDWNPKQWTFETPQNKDAPSPQETVSSEWENPSISELFPDLFPTNKETIDNLNQKVPTVIDNQNRNENPINIIFTNNSQSVSNTSNETANSSVLKPLNSKSVRKYEDITKSNLERIVNKIRDYPEKIQEKILRGENLETSEDISLKKYREILNECVKKRLLLFCAKLKGVSVLSSSKLQVWKELIRDASRTTYVVKVLSGANAFNINFFDKFINPKEIKDYLDPLSEILKTSYRSKNQKPRYGGNSSINLDDPDAANQSKLFLNNVINEIKKLPKEQIKKVLNGNGKKLLEINQIRSQLNTAVYTQLQIFCINKNLITSRSKGGMWIKLLSGSTEHQRKKVCNVLNGYRGKFTLDFFEVFPKEIQSEVKECLLPLFNLLQSDSERETHEGDGRIPEKDFDFDNPDEVDVLSLFPPLPNGPNPYVLGEQQIYPNISLDPFGGQGSSQTTTTTDPTSLTDDFQSWQDLF